ncbi:hypothetical protein LCGC14_0400800 [marine sediment metagenome]|uniref:Uncharacterized protein n=1 Tax=marine sediment metagenome TaxID=412755 RepID=A0A0F9TEW6_9ZZZZ
MTEIALTEAYDRLVAIARANAKNSALLVLYAEVLRKHVAELETEVEELRRRLTLNESNTD